MRAILYVTFIFAFGCPQTKGPHPTTERSAVSRGNDESPRTSSGDETSSCESILAEFNEVKESGSGECTGDDDCALVPILTDCNRATDKATASKLRELRQRFSKKSCVGGVKCKSRRGRAVCNEGRCTLVPR